MKSFIRIYIDTNVLINYCTGQPAETVALDFLFKKKRKEVLFTSSLAIVQTIANLQTAKKTRKAYSREQAIEHIEKLRQKIMVTNLTDSDITEGFSYANKDIEDNIHYVLSKKMKCDAIIINNVSDFDYFKDIAVMKPERGILSVRIK